MMKACGERCPMRAPGILIFGLVLTPCGWILDLASMLTPNWRTVHNITGEDPHLVLSQGLWDICSYYTSSSDIICNKEDDEYFDHRIIGTAQRMMAGSLVMTLIGLAVATFGVRCWTVKPTWTGVCLGGFVIVCSGLLAVMPVAWYAHLLNDIDSPSEEIRVGYCIFLGYFGGIMEILGGFVLFVAAWRHGERGHETGASPQVATAWNPWQITVPDVSGGVSNTLNSLPNGRDSQVDKM